MSDVVHCFSLHSSENIGLLTEQLNNEKENLKEMEQQLMTIENERKALETAKQELINQKQVLDDKLVDYVNQLEMNESKLTTTEKFLREVQSNIQTAETKLEKFKSELREWERRFEQVQDDLSQITDRCDQLHESKDEANRVLQQHTNEHREVDQRLRAIKQQVCEFTRQYEAARNEEQLNLRQLNLAEDELRIAEEEVRLKQEELRTQEALLLGCSVTKVLGLFTIGATAKAALTAKVAQVKAELNDAKMQLETRKNARRDCDQKYATSKNKTLDLSRQVKDKKMEHDQQEQLLSQKTRELTQSKLTFDDLKSQHRQALTRKNELQNDARRTEKRINTTQSNLNTTEGELQKLRQESANCDNQKSDLVAKISTMKTDITRHERSINQHRNLINQNQLELNRKLHEQQETVNKIDQAKQKIELTKRNLGEKENEEKAKKREIVHEEKLLESSKQNISELQQQIQSQQGKLAEVKQQADMNKSEIDLISSKIQQLQDDRIQCEQTRDECGKEMKKQEKLYQDTRVRVQQLSHKIQKLQQKLTVLNERDQQLMSQISNAERELNNKKQVAEQNRAHLIEIKDKNNHIQSARSLVGRRLKEKQTMAADMQKRLEQNKGNFRQSEDVFGKLNVEIKQSNDQLEANGGMRTETLRKLQEYEKTMTDIQIHYFEQNSRLEQLSYQMIDEDIKRRPNHPLNLVQRNARERQQSAVVHNERQQKLNKSNF